MIKANPQYGGYLIIWKQKNHDFVLQELKRLKIPAKAFAECENYGVKSFSMMITPPSFVKLRNAKLVLSNGG